MQAGYAVHPLCFAYTNGTIMFLQAESRVAVVGFPAFASTQGRRRCPHAGNLCAKAPGITHPPTMILATHARGQAYCQKAHARMRAGMLLTSHACNTARCYVAVILSVGCQTCLCQVWEPASKQSRDSSRVCINLAYEIYAKVAVSSEVLTAFCHQEQRALTVCDCLCCYLTRWSWLIKAWLPGPADSHQ